MTLLLFTPAQVAAILALCDRYTVRFDPEAWHTRPDLPDGWVAGQVGPIYVGCSPEGDIHS